MSQVYFVVARSPRPGYRTVGRVRLDRQAPPFRHPPITWQHHDHAWDLWDLAWVSVAREAVPRTHDRRTK